MSPPAEDSSSKAEPSQLPKEVMKELAESGVNTPDEEKRPPESTARVMTRWVALEHMLISSIGFLALCGASLTGSLSGFLESHLQLVMLLIWLFWLITACVVVGFSEPPFTRIYKSITMTRWTALRWSFLAIIVLVPVVGQLAGLTLGISLLASGTAEKKGRQRPFAVLMLVAALGLPLMFLGASYSLTSALLTEVSNSSGGSTLLILRPIHHLGPFASALFVYFSGVALFAILTATGAALWLLQTRRAKQARDAASDQGELSEGEAVIKGVIEPFTTNDVAVRIEIEQEGTESEGSGGWNYKWSEVDRRVQVAPFYLKHVSGERIRVEATEKVYLMDDLEGAILVDETRRIRYAELIPGEEVIATGKLRRGFDPSAEHGGYRGGGEGWILDTPTQGRMLLSTRPLDQPFQRRARVYLLMTLCLIAAFGLGQLFLAPYHLAFWAGRPVMGQMVNHRIDRYTDSDGDVHTKYLISLQAREMGLQFEEPVSESLYNATFGVEQPAPIFYVERNPIWSQLGGAATVNGFVIVPFLIILYVIAIAFLLVGEKGVDWYERKVNDSGHGRLKESRNKGSR